VVYVVFGFHKIVLPILHVSVSSEHAFEFNLQLLCLNINLTSILTASVDEWLVVPEFAGPNPAEVVGFFWHLKNPPHACLRRGSETICSMSQLCAM